MSNIKRKIALYFFLYFFLAGMIAISISSGIFFIFRGIASNADAASHNMWAVYGALLVVLSIFTLVFLLVSKMKKRLFRKVFGLSRDSKTTTFVEPEYHEWGLFLMSTIMFYCLLFHCIYEIFTASTDIVVFLKDVAFLVFPFIISLGGWIIFFARGLFRMIGDKIRQERIKKGLSKSELARRCGASVSNIHNMESGWRKNPGWYTVCAIARELGITLESLKDEVSIGIPNIPGDLFDNTRNEFRIDQLHNRDIVKFYLASSSCWGQKGWHYGLVKETESGKTIVYYTHTPYFDDDKIKERELSSYFMICASVEEMFLVRTGCAPNSADILFDLKEEIL